jgi:acetyl esterase/lipase
VELTLAGEALLDRARALLRDVDEAVSATRSVGGELLARTARHWESFTEVSVADLQEMRTAFERLHAQFEPPEHELDDIRRVAAGLYLGGHPADDPLVSPLSADLAGLPPMLIQAATGDPLLQEARELADHAGDCGVDARFELFPVDTHNFHLFWNFLPEAAQAVQQAGRFARRAARAAQVG